MSHMYQVCWVWARVRPAHTVDSRNVHGYLGGVRASAGRSLEGCRYSKSLGRSQEDGIKSRLRIGSELGMPASQMKLGQLCHLMSQLTGQEQGSRPLTQGDWFSQNCLQMLSSPHPPPRPSGDWSQEKVCLEGGAGWGGGYPFTRVSSSLLPQIRMQTPPSKKTPPRLEPWKDHRSTESWGRCQTPSLLLRLRLGRRGER